MSAGLWLDALSLEDAASCDDVGRRVSDRRVLTEKGRVWYEMRDMERTACGGMGIIQGARKPERPSCGSDA